MLQTDFQKRWNHFKKYLENSIYKQKSSSRINKHTTMKIFLKKEDFNFSRIDYKITSQQYCFACLFSSDLIVFSFRNLNAPMGAVM